MAEAGSMVARTFQRIAPMIQPGVKTSAIDEAVRDSISELGGTPSLSRLPRFLPTVVFPSMKRWFTGFPEIAS